MVDTMAFLPPFIRASRTPPYLTGGLPADNEVLLDAPDDRLGPALVAAGQGPPGPAARPGAGRGRAGRARTCGRAARRNPRERRLGVARPVRPAALRLRPLAPRV